jgi:hypothetical protein
LHVAVSFGGFALLPALLSAVLPLLPSHTMQLYLALALLIPALTYLLLSWVWLIARILQDIGGNPRGGHPVSTEAKLHDFQDSETRGEHGLRTLRPPVGSSRADRRFSEGCVNPAERVSGCPDVAGGLGL